MNIVNLTPHPPRTFRFEVDVQLQHFNHWGAGSMWHYDMVADALELIGQALGNAKSTGWMDQRRFVIKSNYAVTFGGSVAHDTNRAPEVGRVVLVDRDADGLAPYFDLIIEAEWVEYVGINPVEGVKIIRQIEQALREDD